MRIGLRYYCISCCLGVSGLSIFSLVICCSCTVGLLRIEAGPPGRDGPLPPKQLGTVGLLHSWH